MRAIRLAFVFFVLGTILAAAPASAQGTPKLATLGYPELRITITDDAIVAPGTAVAGRTLIAYENTGHELRQSWLVRVPDDVSASDLAGALLSPDGTPPSWFFQGEFVGFPGAVAAGQMTYAVVDLTPGLYFVVDAPFADLLTVVPPAGGAATPTAAAEPAADVDVQMFEYDFRIPATIPAGDHVVKVSNVGREAHEFVLAKSPAPITKEQVMDLIMAGDPAATPAGGGPSLNDLEAGEVAGFGTLSPGLTGWTELTLDPGTYVAFCFVPGPDGTPHAAMGMVQVFTVG
ncbi:MAG TPA: hypothetical protein VH482_30680 [Thermomicrobiales bacterium]|jgi:hypothetical protein